MAPLVPAPFAPAPRRRWIAPLWIAVAVFATAPAGLAQAQTAEDLYREVAKCLGTGDAATAAAKFTELEELFPEHNRTGCAAQVLGLIYAKAGHAQKAEAQFRKVIDEYPDSEFGDGGHVGAQAMYHLARLLQQEGRGDEAEALYDEILESHADALGPGGRKLSELVRRSRGESTQPARSRVDYAGELDFLWRHIRDTYPYFADKQIDWDAVGQEMREQVETVDNDVDFVLLCQEVVRRLEDSHCSISPRGVSLPSDGRAGCDLALSAFGDSEAIVLRVAPGGEAEKAGCRPGWVLTAVDRKPVSRRVEEERDRSGRGYSTPWAAWYRLINRVTHGAPETMAELAFRLPDGEGRKLRVRRTGGRVSSQQWIHPPGTHAGKQVDHAMLRGDLAYMHVRSVAGRGDEPDAALRQEFEAALRAVSGASRAVLDIRGNSGGATDVGKWVLGHFLNQPLEVPRWGTIQPQEPSLPARTVVLIDSGVISSGDGLAAMCRSFPDVFPLLGKPTTGSSGSPEMTEMPSGLFTVRVSTKRIVDQFDLVIEGRGVQPHVPLDWRPADLANGEDSFIKQAVDYLDRR